MFEGFESIRGSSYSHGRAIEILNSTIEELKRKHRLIELGIDPHATGRKLITEERPTIVWDVIRLQRYRDGDFNGCPHFTVDIASDYVSVALTIPDKVPATIRKNLANADHGEVYRQILKRAAIIIQQGAVAEARVMQRHYKNRTKEFLDAVIRFKLETSCSEEFSEVKYQPEWSDFLAALARHKRSNIQFQYLLTFPIIMKELGCANSIELLVDGLCSLKPLIEILG